MGRADFLRLGDWNIQCYRCGGKMKASQAVRNWQGFWVHPEHNEPRQPQDFARALPDHQIPPFTQPMPAPTFVPICTLTGLTGLADFAEADCASVEHPQFPGYPDEQ